MISAEDFELLELGDTIETDPLFPGISTTPLVLRVVADQRTHQGRLEFEATWHGVFVARVAVYEANMKWVEVKG